MIHVEISVEPHHHVTPPHVITQQEFHTVQGALDWYSSLGLQTDSRTAEDVINAAKGEYVQVELELLEVTGREYTNATLAIEGKEGQ